MVKKNKNRQSPESPVIQNGGDSGESGDQKSACSSACHCPHIQKAINLASIKKNLKNGSLAGDCRSCIKDGLKIEREENAPNPGLWLCLQCGHQGCGRIENQHALKHFHVVHSDPHCVAVNTTSWSVWCYSCEVELPSEYRKKLQECVKYLKNLDCPPSSRVTKTGVDTNKDAETENSPMPLADVTNMPHGIRAPKKKLTMISLPRVRGLCNLGNTCFFNSVMQCLAQSPYLLELLQESQQSETDFYLAGGRGLLQKSEQGDEEKKKKGSCEELDPLEGTLGKTKWGSLTEALATTIEELRQDNASAVNPQRLFNKLTTKFPQFGGGDQHDAHELLRHLLDEVRTEDLKRYWVAILDQFGLSRHDTSETVESSVRAQVRAYGRQASELWLLPDPVFRGILVSTVECQDCLHSYQRTEPFYELSLPVTTNKPQPPIMRRKTGGDESFDVCGNVTSKETPSKHQLKKERKLQRKGRKRYQQQQKSSHLAENSLGEVAIQEEASNTAEDGNDSMESEQSDADVEDNVEQEVALHDKLCNGVERRNCNNDEKKVCTEPEEDQNASNLETNVECVALNEKFSNGIDSQNLALHGNKVMKENGVHNCEVSFGKNRNNNDNMGIIMNNSVDCSSNKTAYDKFERNEVVNCQNLNLHSIQKKSTSTLEVSEEKETGIKTICKEENCVNKTGIGEEIVNENQITENGVHAGISDGDKSVERMDISSNSVPVFLAKDSKEFVNEELSVSISAGMNTSTIDSPISNTGSPSSVSSELNVDISASSHVTANLWPIEEVDRPYSRIAFCNDNDSSNLEKQHIPSSLENSFSSIHKTPVSEASSSSSSSSCSKEMTPCDELAKDMAALSLMAQEECGPTTRWDTCSARSADLRADSKDMQLAIPLDVPLCNGVPSDPEPEHVPPEEGDKNGTLAPRYYCEDKECSIESCLNQFTMLELMTGSCKVFCENCSERLNKGKEGKMVATNSTKQYLVSNPPAVLVLHLKRFEVYQNMFRKSPRHVTFPLLLDVAPICNTKCRELPTIRKGQSKVLYSLYGVVQHSGTLHGGHYSAYVKVRAPLKRDDVRWCFLPNNQASEKLEELSKGASIPTEPIPGKWYYVSDSRVNEVNEDRVLHSQAYLLFYERIW